MNEINLSFPYIQHIKECNVSLSEVREFYLYPGMEFRSEVKWWPDSGIRPTLHEGIDICYYCTSSGEEQHITPECRVPVMANGRIFAICQDYLGFTVFIDHLYKTSFRFLSIYAHIIPYGTLKAGDRVNVGDAIGNVADTTGRKNRMPAHLHVSIMTAGRELPAQMFDWDMICFSKDAKLIDPLKMIFSDEIKYRSKNHWKDMHGF